MAEDGAAWFSAGYREARERFLAAAAAAGAHCETLPLEGSGPAGEALSIDTALLGGGPRLLLHLCGTHGVEGYAGSAVQTAFLATRPRPPEGLTLALVHALNPWGMAHLRRCDEANVDLNRNCLPEGEAHAGSDPEYARLDPLLNPASARRFDLFLPRAALWALLRGLPALSRAVASGQHDFPRGLFYGGAGTRPATLRLLAWLSSRLAGSGPVLVIDAHTGLGPRGRETLYAEPGLDATGRARLESALGRRVVCPEDARGAAYFNRGGLPNLIHRAFPDAATVFFTEEFGTLAPVRVLAALRTENRWTFHGGAGPGHWSRRALLEAFCPADPGWRRAVVAAGTATLAAAMGAVA